jgi:hypothetical protein
MCGGAAGGSGSSSGGVSPTRGAGRSVRMSMLGMQRRSAVGAALETHVAADAAQAEQEQVSPAAAATDCQSNHRIVLLSAA